jgi:hypothetical protein
MRRTNVHAEDVQIQSPEAPEDPGTEDPLAGVDTSKYEKPHTWGDSKNNVFGLPTWAAVIVGGIVAAIIVVTSNTVGNRLAHPLPFFATEDQNTRDQIEQAKEKVRLLEIALEERREKERILADQEARRAAGEALLSKNPNEDELLGEVLCRTDKVQEAFVGGFNNSFKHAAPLLARASHVQRVFDRNVAQVQDRASDVTLREFGKLYKQMQDATGDGKTEESTADAGGYDLPNWFVLGDDNDADPPPFALLLGGMFAPAQIKTVKNQCTSQIVWNSVLLSTCAAIAILDMHHTCKEIELKIWFVGIFLINLVDIACCAFIASKCASQLIDLQDVEDNTSRIRPTGNGIWDMYIHLQANSGQFFKGYMAYQGIIDGNVYTCEKALSAFSLLWGVFGVYFSMVNIVEDTLSCDAKVAVWFLHTYSAIFVLFASWTIFGLALWILNKLSHSTVVTTPLMKAAKKSDQETPFKLPVFQILLRSFILRDSCTMLHIKALTAKQDVQKMEYDLQETRQRLSERKQYLDQLEERRDVAMQKEAELKEKYMKRAREMGDQVAGGGDEAQAAQPSEAGLAGSSSTAFGAAVPPSAGLSASDVQVEIRESAAIARQPLLQENVVTSEPEASASSSQNPETQPAADTEEREPESF